MKTGCACAWKRTFPEFGVPSLNNSQPSLPSTSPPSNKTNAFFFLAYQHSFQSRLFIVFSLLMNVLYVSNRNKLTSVVKEKMRKKNKFTLLMKPFNN